MKNVEKEKTENFKLLYLFIVRYGESVRYVTMISSTEKHSITNSVSVLKQQTCFWPVTQKEIPCTYNFTITQMYMYIFGTFFIYISSAFPVIYIFLSPSLFQRQFVLVTPPGYTILYWSRDGL